MVCNTLLLARFLCCATNFLKIVKRKENLVYWFNDKLMRKIFYVGTFVCSSHKWHFLTYLSNLFFFISLNLFPLIHYLALVPNKQLGRDRKNHRLPKSLIHTSSTYFCNFLCVLLLNLIFPLVSSRTFITPTFCTD